MMINAKGPLGRRILALVRVRDQRTDWIDSDLRPVVRVWIHQR